MNSYIKRVQREQSYTISKKRWHWAYRRVKTQLYIIKITKHLNKLYKNYYLKSPATVTEASNSSKSSTTYTTPPNKNAGSSLMKPSSSVSMKSNGSASKPEERFPAVNMNALGIKKPVGGVNKVLLASAEDPSSATATPLSSPRKRVVALPSILAPSKSAKDTSVLPLLTKPTVTTNSSTATIPNTANTTNKK